jgi:hypothetical protein
MWNPRLTRSISIAQKIYQNLTRQEHLKRDKLCQKLGEHHLGNVYPLGDDFKEWYLGTNREERSNFLEESMRERVERQRRQETDIRVEYQNNVRSIRTGSRYPQPRTILDMGEIPASYLTVSKTHQDAKDGAEKITTSALITENTGSSIRWFGDDIYTNKQQSQEIWHR